MCLRRGGRWSAGRGGRIADSLAGSGAAEVSIPVVFDDAAIREITFGPTGIVQMMFPGATHIAMETISPGLARELHAAHRERGQRFLAAPVSGRLEAAAKAELAIMCSGPEEVFQAVDPIRSVAGTTRWIGPEPEQAMAVKLGGNHMILGMGELWARHSASCVPAVSNHPTRRLRSWTSCCRG